MQLGSYSSIVKCEQAFFYKDRFWIILELMDGGAFTSMLEEMQGNYSEGFCKYTLHRTVQGLIDLHRQNIIPSGIKSDNILCKESGEIKIADFGFAVMLTKQQTSRSSRVGSICWMAPELIVANAKRDRMYSNKVDIWSLGIFAIELAQGLPPYIDAEPERALFNIVQNQPPAISSKWSSQF